MRGDLFGVDVTPELPPRVLVYCETNGDAAAEPVPARLHGRAYFCSLCGATDHAGYEPSDDAAIDAASGRG
jgi:hypothetical protein